MADKKHDDEASFPAVTETHPLPTDHPDSAGDSTQGNAPFAPADITPEGAQDADGEAKSSKSSKSEAKSEKSDTKSDD